MCSMSNQYINFYTCLYDIIFGYEEKVVKFFTEDYTRDYDIYNEMIFNDFNYQYPFGPCDIVGDFLDVSHLSDLQPEPHDGTKRFSAPMHQINDSYFRRGQNPDGWSPGACSSAQVQIALGELCQLTGRVGVKYPGDEVEGKDLPLVGMAGKLQVEKTDTIEIDFRSVFQE